MEGFEMRETHYAPIVTSTVTILNDVDDETDNNVYSSANNNNNYTFKNSDKHDNKEEG